MLIREALYEDLELVAKLRLEFLAEHRRIESTQFPDSFMTTTLDFLRRHAEAKTSRSWLAQHDGLDVGVVTMLMLDLAPRPEDISGTEGYIVNMYVTPEHRRSGAGRDLLRACRGAAEELCLRRLLLYATDDGRPLYASAGFRPNPNWMELPM